MSVVRQGECRSVGGSWIKVSLGYFKQGKFKQTRLLQTALFCGAEKASHDLLAVSLIAQF